MASLSNPSQPFPYWKLFGIYHQHSFRLLHLMPFFRSRFRENIYRCWKQFEASCLGENVVNISKARSTFFVNSSQWHFAPKVMKPVTGPPSTESEIEFSVKKTRNLIADKGIDFLSKIVEILRRRWHRNGAIHVKAYKLALTKNASTFGDDIRNFTDGSIGLPGVAFYSSTCFDVVKRMWCNYFLIRRTVRSLLNRTFAFLCGFSS